MNHSKILTLFALAALALRCSDKDDIPAPDPCIDKKPFSAAIKICEAVGDTAFETTKILAPGYGLMKAVGEYDSVRWFLGGPQNTSKNRDYMLYFQNEEGQVDVTFIGYKKPATQCFPNDKSSDTVRSSFQVIRRDNRAEIVGTFLGYNESNPGDKFPVTISFYDDVWGYFLKGIPKGCPGYTIVSEEYPRNIGLAIQAGNRGFRINEGSRACSNVLGKGFLQSQDTLIIQYTYHPVASQDPLQFDDVTRKEKFIGIRQP